jgi:hypothetical protein
VKFFRDGSGLCTRTSKRWPGSTPGRHGRSVRPPRPRPLRLDSLRRLCHAGFLPQAPARLLSQSGAPSPAACRKGHALHTGPNPCVPNTPCSVLQGMFTQTSRAGTEDFQSRARFRRTLPDVNPRITPSCDSGLSVCRACFRPFRRLDIQNAIHTRTFPGWTTLILWLRSPPAPAEGRSRS